MSSTDELCRLLDDLEMDYERDGDVIRFRHDGTDRLRAMLDELGIPWKDYGHPHRTWWGAWYAEERPSVNGLFLKVEGIVTPEQAIAATLGRGTCHPIISDNLTESEGTGDAWADCSECGHLLFVLTDPSSKPPHYCPGCGKRIVGD